MVGWRTAWTETRAENDFTVHKIGIGPLLSAARFLVLSHCFWNDVFVSPFTASDLGMVDGGTLLIPDST